MNYRKLGKSELKVSELSFGAMSLKGEYSQDKALLFKALDKGINFFDTADLYNGGENEKWIGKAFKGMRDNVVLATKVGNQWKEDGSGWIWNPSKAYIFGAVEQSLKRLQTDYIDLYQLHGGTIEDPIDETIEAFEALKKAGKIRDYGISSIRPNVIREYVKRSHMVSVMTQYSLLDRRPEETTLTLLQENQIGVLVRGAVAKGLLVNKAPKAYLGHTENAIKEIQIKLKNLDPTDGSPAQTAIKYALAHPAVTTIVAGASHPDQLTENVEAIQQSPLSAQIMEALKDMVPQFVYDKHR